MRIKLDKYISELLYGHDIVIVPAFGAFVTQYRAARIDSEALRIEASGKLIAFNPLIKADDGILTHFIAKEQQISYAESAAFIAESVKGWEGELQFNKKIRLNKIGEIQLNQDKKLIFKPYNSYNYHSESFGFRANSLKSFVHRSIELDKRIYLELNKYRQEQATVRRSDRSKRPVLYYSLAATLAVFVGLWTFFLTTEPFISEQASLGFVTVQSIMADELSHTENIPSPLVGDDDVEETGIESSEINDAVQQSHVEKETTKPDANLPHYYIIGGCFKDYDNAVNFRNDLIRRQYSDSEVLNDKATFYRVSYGKFTDSHQANNLLNIIRGKENLSAWILKQ